MDGMGRGPFSRSDRWWFLGFPCFLGEASPEVVSPPLPTLESERCGFCLGLEVEERGEAPNVDGFFCVLYSFLDVYDITSIKIKHDMLGNHNLIIATLLGVMIQIILLGDQGKFSKIHNTVWYVFGDFLVVFRWFLYRWKPAEKKKISRQKKLMAGST